MLMIQMMLEISDVKSVVVSDITDDHGDNIIIYFIMTSKSLSRRYPLDYSFSYRKI